MPGDFFPNAPFRALSYLYCDVKYRSFGSKFIPPQFCKKTELDQQVSDISIWVAETWSDRNRTESEKENMIYNMIDIRFGRASKEAIHIGQNLGRALADFLND